MRPLKYETRVALWSFLGALPAVVTSLTLLWTQDFSFRTQITATLLIIITLALFSFALVDGVVRPIQTVTNLLSALRESDFSLRGKHSKVSDVLSELMTEVNTLSDTLREQRLGALEATALLKTVMEEIDVAVFAFDGNGILRIVNRAGATLMKHTVEQMLGASAERLNMTDLLLGSVPRTISTGLVGEQGPFELRRTTFRQAGLEHQLLVLTNVLRVTREEEKIAWQRLVRVMGHEINNSLAPIYSIATQLQKSSKNDAHFESDFKEGLEVISRRAEGLNRFMQGYSKLARLPAPVFAAIDVQEWVSRICALERRLRVNIISQATLTIRGDAAQLDKLLINVIQNAVDAALMTKTPEIELHFAHDANHFVLRVIDNGPGISNPSNLFVPFYTTKPNGSGIGLALSRQIAEAHHGSFELKNRESTQGCVAEIILPFDYALSLAKGHRVGLTT